MPSTLAAQTRELLRHALDDMGEDLSRRRLDRLTFLCIAIWSGDEEPTGIPDPTAREAIRRVMNKMEVAA